MTVTGVLLALVASLPAPAEVFFADSSRELDGEILGWRFVTLEQGELPQLCVTTRAPGGVRELHVFATDAGGVTREPSHVVPILDDVLTVGFADVRSEPGKEVILLTRTGAWSYSLTKSGYKGNVARLAEEDLIYDFPDPSELPFWRYELPRMKSGREPVLLPGKDGFTVWGPSSTTEDAPYQVMAHFPTEDVAASDRVSGRRSEAGDSGEDSDPDISLAFESRRNIFLAQGPSRSLLRGSRSYRAPALADVDGDGQLDLVHAREDGIYVHLWNDGYAAEATRVEPIPDYLRPNPDDSYLSQTSWTLADLDGDKDADLIVHWVAEVEGFENAKQRLQVLINDGRRMLPEKPNQVLRFEAAEVRFEVVDVDGDGRQDLSLREFKLPSLIGTVTGLEFTLTHLLYLGRKGGLVEKKPAFRRSESFDETTVDLAIANRHHKLDADGDGVADLVEADIHGRVAIRRVTKKSSFFGGDKWQLDEKPWKRFDARGGILSLYVEDLNQDGILDVVSKGGRNLTILYSQKRGN